MNEHSAYKKPVFSQPTSDPTPLKQVRFVTLGGPDAGIFTLSEHCEIPGAASAGPCQPLSVLCRSPADAEKVWQLQPLIKVVEERTRREVAAAVIMSVVVRRLFADDQTPRFHVAFLRFFNRPVVYFSWADAYPSVQRFSREGKPPCVQLVKTFLDALILCCLGAPAYPSIEEPMQYLRPKMPIHFPTYAKAQHSTGPVIVISDSESTMSEDEASVSVDMDRGGTVEEVVAPTVTANQTPSSTIPKSVREIIEDVTYDEQFILVHARSINGETVRSFRCLPAEKELLPSLGQEANRLMDALGYLPPTVYRIYATYRTVRHIDDPHEAEKAFIRELGAHKLSLLEAALVWRCITQTNSKVGGPSREREAWGTV